MTTLVFYAPQKSLFTKEAKKSWDAQQKASITKEPQKSLAESTNPIRLKKGVYSNAKRQ